VQTRKPKYKKNTLLLSTTVQVILYWTSLWIKLELNHEICVTALDFYELALALPVGNSENNCKKACGSGGFTIRGRPHTLFHFTALLLHRYFLLFKLVLDGSLW